VQQDEVYSSNWTDEEVRHFSQHCNEKCHAFTTIDYYFQWQRTGMMQLVQVCSHDAWAAVLQLRRETPSLTGEQFRHALAEAMPDLTMADPIASFLLDWGIDDLVTFQEWLPHVAPCTEVLERLVNSVMYQSFPTFVRVLMNICKLYSKQPGPPYVTLKLHSKPAVFVAKRTPAANVWLRVVSTAAVLLRMLIELIDEEALIHEALVRTRRLHVLSNGFCNHHNTHLLNEDMHRLCSVLESESLYFEDFTSEHVRRYSDKIGHAETVQDYTSLTSLQGTLQSWIMRCRSVKKLL
jgi:hypothetical protein